MADKVIWNDDETMNFLAHTYIAARITYPQVPADKEACWVRVHLKGSIPDGVGHDTGLQYAHCSNKEEAKKCLAKLTEKLVRAGVIEVTESEGGSRFDHVELPEVHHE